MNRWTRIATATLCVGFLFVSQARSVPIDSELERLQGGWRVTEMVENGHVMSAAEMSQGLPGGGILEIIDYTVLFKSPVSGARSTRSFRLDPTTYPKQIALLDGDQVTGVGIYQIDKGKLVMCVTAPNVPVPTDFSAPENSGRTMMVMARHRPEEGAAAAAKVALPPPPQNTRFTSTQAAAAAVPTAVKNPSAAGKILSDADVIRLLQGSWRLNDGEGLVDITFNGNSTFSSYRHTQTMNNFHSVFVAKPVSAGTWQVQNGQLTLTITSSWRPDRTNTRATFAVRSISQGDAIIVDGLGRVSRANRQP